MRLLADDSILYRLITSTQDHHILQDYFNPLETEDLKLY